MNGKVMVGFVLTVRLIVLDKPESWTKADDTCTRHHLEPTPPPPTKKFNKMDPFSYYKPLKTSFKLDIRLMDLDYLSIK